MYHYHRTISPHPDGNYHPFGERVEELSCFECRRLGYAVFEGLGLDCNVGADSSLGQGFVTLWFKFLYSFGLNYSDDSIPDVQVKDRF